MTATSASSPQSTVVSSNLAESATLTEQFLKVRLQSERICAPLSAEDMMVQSCVEASPAKWHMAHTTWFYETFILSQFAPNYRPFNADFVWLFNSYYNSISEHPEKKLRASFSRPPLDAIYDYRRHVDAAVVNLLNSGGDAEDVSSRVILGLHHEQQHQELLLTDVKHAFWTNPLHPAYVNSPDRPGSNLPGSNGAPPLTWLSYPVGLRQIGFAGEGFSFDNERPQHQEFVEAFELASRPTTCGEYLEFMLDGGYKRPELWLSEGWEAVQAQGWRSPLYWHRESGRHGAVGHSASDSALDSWSIFTLKGNNPLGEMLATPVCHVSYFEADAFARWSGRTLPTEAEWETAAHGIAPSGNFLESNVLHPLPDSLVAADRSDGYVLRITCPNSPHQIFGDVWEWTRSPYVGYPHFEPLPGALGEYNGKFMCNQMVLRGGSAVTPALHIRETYRNFFSAATRWQFSGIRLTKVL